jgi:glutamyl-tRNA reductase
LGFDVHFLLVGVSHKTAPVDLRERLDFSSRSLGDAVEALVARPSAEEAVVLSTCNRSEIYVASADPARARAEIVAFLGEYHRLSRESFAPHLFSYGNGDAARHLFRVAAGLDSLVVGEPQILGQVKDALEAAAERRCTGPALSKLFHWSFGVGKRVRSETALGEGAVSIGFAAVALARKIFGRMQGRRALIVGAGEISSLTARHLQSQGVDQILVTSRTTGHAEALAASVEGRALAWDELSSALSTVDIVVTATGSQRPILTRAHVQAAFDRHHRGPLFIIDLAVPRDVEVEVGEIEQVFLYNVDDLQGIVQENLSRRGAEIARAEAIVAEEVERFAAWQRSRGAIPTVVALRQRFDAIRRSELDRLDEKLAGLTPESRRRVDEVTRLIVEKLLVEPTERLKALPDEETQAAYTEAINRLFHLREDDTDAEPDDAAAEVRPADPRRPSRRT